MDYYLSKPVRSLDIPVGELLMFLHLPSKMVGY